MPGIQFHVLTSRKRTAATSTKAWLTSSSCAKQPATFAAVETVSSCAKLGYFSVMPSNVMFQCAYSYCYHWWVLVVFLLFPMICPRIPCLYRFHCAKAVRRSCTSIAMQGSQNVCQYMWTTVRECPFHPRCFVLSPFMWALWWWWEILTLSHTSVSNK